MNCGAVIEHRKNRGRVCGRAVRAFVAPGIGRCALHATAMERTRALAILRGVREMLELRGCPREPEERGEDDEQPSTDEPTDSERDFDPVGFVDPALDEL